MKRYLTALLAFVSFHIPASAAVDCTAGTSPCSPRDTCCPSGSFCNFNRGIPVCIDPQFPIITGFDHNSRCADPYLMDCSQLIGVGGFCCPIGTVCYNNGLDQHVSCVDAYGTTASSFPSATVSVVPSATPVPIDSPAVQFNPSNAWNSSSAPISNCIPGNIVRVTNVVNATVSFNYTGQSILIHTVKSPRGGVFSMTVDSVPLNDTIDTFNAGGELCFPVQFPPFRKPPPGFALRNDHSITLSFQGPSKNAPKDITSIDVQFGSFAIPQVQTAGSALTTGLGAYQLILLTFFVSYCIIGKFDSLLSPAI
ncbi:hypothetical protein B0H34DRAFT_247096 [Crassisporium funariophilum]|nr:hypothetical protein B0H34DRAFT_247096 [Crassisporium funariophilum]